MALGFRKITGSRTAVQEQLNAQIIEKSASQSLEFFFFFFLVIKKKYGKWTMLTDLRATQSYRTNSYRKI